MPGSLGRDEINFANQFCAVLRSSGWPDGAVDVAWLSNDRRDLRHTEEIEGVYKLTRLVDRILKFGKDCVEEEGALRER